MAFMMTLTLGAVIWIVLASCRRGAAHAAPRQPSQLNGPPATDPKRILDERLARGELDIEDYRARLDLLSP